MRQELADNPAHLAAVQNATQGGGSSLQVLQDPAASGGAHCRACDQKLQ